MDLNHRREELRFPHRTPVASVPRRWSQSPVLPRVGCAYETRLDIGPTAWSLHPDSHRARSHTKGAHRCLCFGGVEDLVRHPGVAPGRSAWKADMLAVEHHCRGVWSPARVTLPAHAGCSRSRSLARSPDEIGGDQRVLPPCLLPHKQRCCSYTMITIQAGSRGWIRTTTAPVNSRRLRGGATRECEMVGAERLARSRLPDSKSGGSAVPREPRAAKLEPLVGLAPTITGLRNPPCSCWRHRGKMVSATGISPVNLHLRRVALCKLSYADIRWRSRRDSHPLVIRLERATARRLCAQEQMVGTAGIAPATCSM